MDKMYLESKNKDLRLLPHLSLHLNSMTFFEVSSQLQMVVVFNVFAEDKSRLKKG